MSLHDHGISESIVPSGGWRYVQIFQGQPYRIPDKGEAESGAQLVIFVKRFRINNGIEMGSPEMDIAEYMKKVSPQNDIYKRHDATPPQKVRPKKSMLQCLREWVDEKIEERPDLVTKTEATERSEMCRGCIQNIKWKSSGCGECNQEVEYRGNVIRKINVFDADDGLMGCRLHQAHIPTLIFLDRAFLPDRSENAPPNCWIPQKT